MFQTNTSDRPIMETIVRTDTKRLQKKEKALLFVGKHLRDLVCSLEGEKKRV